MRRWDYLLAVAVLLVVAAAVGFDWRVGCAVAAVCLGGIWYWLDEAED